MFEVGTPPPHNSDMAYGLETGNNNNIGIVQVGKNFKSGYICVTSLLVAKGNDVGFVNCRNHNCL